MREKYASFASIVSDVGDELGLTINPTGVLGSTDRDARQIGKLVVATTDDLITRFPWRSDLGTNPYILSAANSPQYKVMADDDIILMDSRILILGTKWRYLHAKGLTYDEEFRYYEKRIADFAFARNSGMDVDTNVTAPTVI